MRSSWPCSNRTRSAKPVLEEIATYLLVAGLTAFAVCAVLLNEGEHRRRRAARRAGTAAGFPPAPGPTTPAAEEATQVHDAREPGDRRLPVGDFLFGALYVSGEEPVPFAALAERAAGSGLNVSQVLAWLERAEESGLIERVVDADQETGEPHEPAVRLTAAGMEIARSNRRGVGSRQTASGR